MYKIDIPGVEPTVEFDFEATYYTQAEKQTLECQGCEESIEFLNVTWDRGNLTAEENIIVENSNDFIQMRLEELYREECEQHNLEMQINHK